MEKDITGLIREIVWAFGAQSADGRCCGNLSAPESRALRMVYAEQDCAMQDIARSLGFTKSGATRVIDRLENKKLVSRQRNADDGRVCCVRTTTSGDALIQQINRDAEQRVASVLENMEPAMQTVLRTALEAFVEKL